MQAITTHFSGPTNTRGARKAIVRDRVPEDSCIVNPHTLGYDEPL